MVVSPELELWFRAAASFCAKSLQEGAKLCLLRVVNIRETFFILKPFQPRRRRWRISSFQPARQLELNVFSRAVNSLDQFWICGNVARQRGAASGKTLWKRFFSYVVVQAVFTNK